MKPYEIKVSPAPTTAAENVEAEESAFVRAVVGMGAFVAAAITVGLIVAIATLLGGCALERADPAARSARATYGPISMVASGDGATCNLTLGDGAFTAADGEGAITQPSTFTTTQNPDLSGAAGIAAAAKVGGKALDAYAARQAAKAAEANAKAKSEGSQSPATATPADCENCGIEDADCVDGGL